MGELLLRRTFRGGTDDHPRILGDDLLEDLLQPGALVLGQFAADPAHRPAGYEDHVAPGEADLAGEPGSLVPDRILGYLDEDRLARFQDVLDPARAVGPPQTDPVDLAGVDDGVPAAADVDERRLHRRQHVLDPAEMNVADHGLLGRPADVVLDQHVVFEYPDLDPVAGLADDHDPVDGFAAGQELGLADDRRPAPAGLAALPPALLLGLEAGRTLQRRHLVAGVRPRLPDADHRVRWVVRRRFTGFALAFAAPATPPTAGCRCFLLGGLGGLLGSIVARGRIHRRWRMVLARGLRSGSLACHGLRGLARLVAGLLAPAAAAAPPASPRRLLVPSRFVGLGRFGRHIRHGLSDDELRRLKQRARSPRRRLFRRRGLLPRRSLLPRPPGGCLCDRLLSGCRFRCRRCRRCRCGLLPGAARFGRGRGRLGWGWFGCVRLVFLLHAGRSRRTCLRGARW